MERTWIAAATVASVAGVALLLWPSADAGTPRLEVVASRPAEAPITVHVSGAVAEPGLVMLPAGARVADAILAAGGAKDDAVLTSLNLAAPLSDGQQLVVPREETGSWAGSPGDGRIPINTAGAAALEGLPGVGQVLAQRIVEHRERNGPFTVVEDLLEVPGIGEAKLAALRDMVLVP
ncbi:MAG TPA: ComEA family DNA-binding protein [Acidimicrobiia bacterium]|nr:ComEA family DNA-binding protein [Acidimicrobiia bacterium]